MSQVSQWRTPRMPGLAPIVAFEHHLKKDVSGDHENLGSHQLNLCTMNLSMADAFDAQRKNRHTWDRDDRGEHPCAVVETVDPESVDIDPLEYL